MNNRNENDTIRNGERHVLVFNLKYEFIQDKTLVSTIELS